MKRIIFTIAFTLVLGVVFQNSLTGQSQLKSVHEWGTFTTVQNSAGQRLAGLKGEKLPAFVYDMNPGSKNNVTFKNVEVQMETPVLYFYSDKQLDAKVNVKFKNGVINQWFPDRSSGQSFASSSVIDLSVSNEGSNDWDITILDTAARVKYQGGPSMQEYETPRRTSSRYIKIRDKEEYEKFIFYRGLANFETPVKVEFNDKNNLVIHNLFNTNLNYVMVFDNSPSRQPTVWWSGSMKSGERKVIANPSKDNVYEELNQHIDDFLGQLIKEGLYLDEAEALLNTWYDSYFMNLTDVEGLRVFWITPSSFVNDILPLSITPNPLSIQRVFVGRSEILTKDFEKELSTLTLEKIDTKYKDHHYVNVFKDAKLKGLPTNWTEYNENVVTSVINKNKSPLTLKLMPNPIADALIVQYRSDDLSELQIAILDMNGKIIHHWKETPNDLIYKKSYSLKDLQSGTYILQTSQMGKIHSLKFIKQ